MRSTAEGARALPLDPGERILPAPEPDDPSLVSLARRGDRAAFQHLYRRHSTMVQAILLCRIPRADVPDLVQDVFVTALRKLHALRDDASFAAWLGSIARHRAADFHRTPLRVVQSAVEPSVSAGAMSEALQALAAIQALPEAYREPLLLRLVAGFTGPEIAERTGLTPGSVRVNLHRGMKLLRAALEGGTTP